MPNVHLFVDGNYTFFISRELGKNQDFKRITSQVEAALNVEVIESKHFYSRPPSEADPRSVYGWLKANGWNVHSYVYDHTHQDSLYVTMISDLYRLYLTDPDATFVIISGSGALTYPLKSFPGDLVICSTEKSINTRLGELPNISKIDLREIL